MDLMVVKQYALALQEKLELYSDNEDVVTLTELLTPLLEQAIAGDLIDPVDIDDMPGLMMFDDGVFEDFEDLEDAYGDFQVEVTGESADDEEEDEDEDDNE